jgi:hypothetical protein
MKTAEELEAKLISFLTSALAGCKWSSVTTQPPCLGGKRDQ